MGKFQDNIIEARRLLKEYGDEDQNRRTGRTTGHAFYIIGKVMSNPGYRFYIGYTGLEDKFRGMSELSYEITNDHAANDSLDLTNPKLNQILIDTVNRIIAHNKLENITFNASERYFQFNLP